MSRKRWEDELSRDELLPGVRPLWGSWTLHRPAPDLTGCLAGRLPRARHLLVVWEPIATKAPSPARCQPHCCYTRTVIFYHRPYVTGWARGGRDMAGVFHRDWNREFLMYDQVETRLSSDDAVEFDGDEFLIGGGHVQWHHKQWWMRRWARRREVR